MRNVAVLILYRLAGLFARLAGVSRYDLASEVNALASADEARSWGD